MPKQVITGGGPQGDGVLIGESASEKVGFFAATPVDQPVGATQAAVTDTTTNGAASSAADLAALKTECEAIGDTLRATVILVNKLRTDLVELGLIKGAA